MNSNVVSVKCLIHFAMGEKYPRSDVDSIADVDSKTVSNTVKEGVTVVISVAVFD